MPGIPLKLNSNFPCRGLYSDVLDAGGKWVNAEALRVVDRSAACNQAVRITVIDADVVNEPSGVSRVGYGVLRRYLQNIPEKAR